MKEAWKIGWKKGSAWKYVTVFTKGEMLAEVADKTTLSDKVSVKKIHMVTIPNDTDTVPKGIDK